MITYILRRLAVGVGVLLLATVLVFVLVAESGNPIGALLANPHIPRSVIRLKELQLHLNDPMWQRYWIWFSHVLRGDFGVSNNGLAVRHQLEIHLFVTLRMVILSTVLSIFLAITVGLISALRYDTIVDRGVSVVNFLFLSVPVFVVGLVLKTFVAVPIDQHFHRVVLATAGEQNPLATGNFFQRLPDYASHTILPTLTLVLATYASWAIYQRSTLLDVMDSDYVRLARAKGISPRRVLLRHILRNALIPVTTVIALDFAGVLGGAVITETVYGWNGLGRFFLDGVNNLDVNVTLAYLLLTAVIVIVFNLMADIAYGVLDPRIRYGKR
jgi:peptide/nickel transport system permease protein